ncbi:hypothetical protein [Ectothiorhodospira lacustris]|uniref:hypothetical protein n=1 Tax=Ectothiorhodospira lacustris TaxID=2899127 RepID=UPI001EE7C93F|nr:hypothetical protein [Ectothiorhodospira lacustris]MCG5499870.1 hypothetical protein [Ectothiorhodospira lacustris]
MNTPAHSLNPQQLHKENQQLREQVVLLAEQLKDAQNQLAFFHRELFGRPRKSPTPAARRPATMP